MLWFLTTDLKWRRLLTSLQFADEEIKVRVVKLLAQNHWPSMSEPKSACVHTCLLSHFSHVQLFATLWTVAHQASHSMGFFRQEYWSGLTCPPPRDLPDPQTERASLTSPALARRFFITPLAHLESHKPKSTWLQTSLSLVHATLKILKLGDIFLMTPRELWSMDHCKR